MTNKYIDEVATYLPFSGEHSQLIADTTYAYSRSLNKYVVSTGDHIEVSGGQIYEVAASGASDQHFTTAGGVKLYESGPDFTNKTRAEEWKTRLDAASRTVKDGYIITFAGVTAKAVSGSTSIPSLDDFEYSGFTPDDETKLDNIATQYDDVTAFLASNDTFADNTYVGTKKEGFSYKAVPSGDVTNAGGQGFEVQSGIHGYNVMAFGAVGDGSRDTHTGTDDTNAFKSAITAARRDTTTIYAPARPNGTGYVLQDTLFFGPLSQSDLGFPQSNVCLGLIGDQDESTYLICGDSLSGKVVLDYTGLGHKYAKNFQLWRNTEANAPSVGILTARFLTGTGGVTGNYGGEFSDIVMFKYFSVAGRLAITTEETDESRLNIRNDHADSYGCFVSTSDGSSGSYASGPTWNAILGEVSESSLLREDVAGSNLHQTHTKCDYYYGNNSPDAAKDPCMLRIDGANGFLIRDPFFNNNTARVDCVQIRIAGASGVPYGIAVTNPLYHQETKSGVRVMTGINRLSLHQSNTLPGFGFVDAELVIDGFLSGSEIYGVDSVEQNEIIQDSVVSYVSGTYSQYNTMNNCTVSSVNSYSMAGNNAAIFGSSISCQTFGWNTNASIQTSDVRVLTTLNATGSRTGSPRFKLHYQGLFYTIEGQINGSWLGTPANLPTESLENVLANSEPLSTLYNRSTSNQSLIIEHENGGYSGNMIEMRAPSGSSGAFNYRALTRGGSAEITEKKDGVCVYEKTAGGPVLTDQSNGNQYRLVSTAGVLSLVLYT